MIGVFFHILLHFLHDWMTGRLVNATDTLA
jgi:hypothetical protein